MNTPTTHTGRSSHHPLMIAAAIAVILFCLAGTAAIMGWLPSSIGGSASKSELTASDRAALASRLADTARPATEAERYTLQSERERELAMRNEERDIAQRNQSRSSAASNVSPNALAAHDNLDSDVHFASNESSMPPASNYRRVSQQSQQPLQLAHAEPARRATCGNCGRVESVRTIKTRAEGSGVGAAGGAILGGLLGNQIGGGNGRKLATVAGAVGGAVVGNQVEGNMKARISYEVLVRMDNGKSRTFHLQNLNGYNSGDRIRVVNGALRHAG